MCLLIHYTIFKNRMQEKQKSKAKPCKILTTAQYKSTQSVVYHPQLVAVYHQNEVLYIIIAKVFYLYTLRVMRYNNGSAAVGDIQPDG